MTNLMQLIKIVLDDAYQAIHDADEADKDKQIAKELLALAMEYSNLTDAKAEPIDYSDPLKRFSHTSTSTRLPMPTTSCK